VCYGHTQTGSFLSVGDCCNQSDTPLGRKGQFNSLLCSERKAAENGVASIFRMHANAIAIAH